MPRAGDPGGLLSTGSPNQMRLGLRSQAAGQQRPETLQTGSFLQTTEGREALREAILYYSDSPATAFAVEG